MKIFVMGKRWKITCFNDKTYEKRLGSGSAGISILEDRKIYIKRSDLNLETIAHEIVHAYLHELSYIELNLDEDQIEEFFCELIAKHSTQIMKDSYKAFIYFSH